MSKYRSNTCGDLNTDYIGKKVKLSGWVQKVRNLGGMQFIDLRDQYGITQVIISDNNELASKIKDIYSETIIMVEGIVQERSNKNEQISTGEIEILAENIEILGKCKSILPFEINNDSNNVREDLRLEYRYLDLRNKKIHDNILLRASVIKSIRRIMDDMGFTEIQTPILTSSSPEGARDFLVPSRLHPGEFYALPQAPQQFKQLLMISGFDKYYQIAPCFRDEDPRADRSPGEFYQLDFEMSFATEQDVFKVLEQVILGTFKEHTDWKIDEAPLKKIPFKEAMEKYGTDKPDLRNPLIIQDVTEIFKNSDLNAFKGKTVKAIVCDKAFEQSRKFFDNLSEFAVEQLEAKGLAWVKIDSNNNWLGTISKYIKDETKQQLLNVTKANIESAIFFIADEFKQAQKIAGGVRVELARRLDVLEKECYRFCLIVDFPMYEQTEDGKIEFSHNPFSMPQGEMKSLLTKDPLDIEAYQYDLVCNGYEIASGAVRNHDPELMIKAFEIAGYTQNDVKSRFGALFNAFQYGAPPHAGCAPGLDRIVMLLAKEDNIRQVIAFPKNKKAQDLLMKAPSTVSDEQLKEVHIKLDI